MYNNYILVKKIKKLIIFRHLRFLQFTEINLIFVSKNYV